MVKLVALGEKILLMHSHFFSHEKISAFFDGKEAQSKVVLSENEAMVLIEKVR